MNGATGNPLVPVDFLRGSVWITGAFIG